MGNRLTLEEQLRKAEARDRKIYTENILRVVEGERTPKLCREVRDASTFVILDAERLFTEIMRNEDNGHPTPEKYIRKLENASAFAYLIGRNLIEVQKHRHLGIFKRTVIVPKYITISDSNDIEKYKNYL